MRSRNEITEDEYKHDPRGERALVNAILVQAFNDALGKSTAKDRLSALRFIDDQNPLFCFYCWLIGWDPEYIARKFYKRLGKHDLHPLSRFRK